MANRDNPFTIGIKHPADNMPGASAVIAPRPYDLGLTNGAVMARRSWVQVIHDLASPPFLELRYETHKHLFGAYFFRNRAHHELVQADAVAYGHATGLPVQTPR